VRRGKRRDTYFEKDYFREATDGTDDYWDYLGSSDRCSSLVQAVLWRILFEKVFRRYVWAGYVRKSMREVHNYLKPGEIATLSAGQAIMLVANGVNSSLEARGQCE
jgi:hypothetical protein